MNEKESQLAKAAGNTVVIVHRIEVGQRIEVLGVDGQWVECEVIAYSKAGSLSRVFIEAQPTRQSSR